MFWSSIGESNRIEVASMDGSDVKNLIDTKIGTVSGLTLDYVQERVYWIDFTLKAIESCAYDGTKRFTLLHSTRLIQRPFSLAIFENHLYWADVELFSLRAMNRFNGSLPVTLHGRLQRPRSVVIYQQQLQPDGKTEVNISAA